MIYLDNAATTQPKFFASDYDMWFNTNASYVSTENIKLEECRNKIKQLLGVTEGKVLFTRCATESVQLLASKIKNMRCTKESHDSVWDCSTIVGRGGLLSSGQLVNQLCGKINKFTLTANQIEDIFYGCDITAAIGHAHLANADLNKFDAIWWSGHKFHAEKGIGGLWISDRLADYLGASSDSHNQYNLIHGTLNLPAVMAMADAMNEVTSKLDYNLRSWSGIRSTMANAFEVNGIVPKIYGLDWYDCHTTPAINLIYLPGINADALQQYLASKQIYVGLAASACAGNHNYRVAEALGLTEEEARQSIRVSYSEDTTIDDVIELVKAIQEFKKLFV